MHDILQILLIQKTIQKHNIYMKYNKNEVLIIIYNKMQYPNNTLLKKDLQTVLRNDNSKPFPVIDNRKLSFQMDQHSRYIFKLSRGIGNQGNTQPICQTNQEKQSKNEDKQSIFSVPKETIFFKKRVFISPNKVITKQRLYQTLESDLVKKQIQDLRTVQQQVMYRDKDIFNTVLKEFSGIDKQDVIGNYKPTSKQVLYQPYRKRSQKQKDRLKPITSQSHLKNGELEFFNVEKIVLLDGDKSKKSNSLLIKSFGQYKQQKTFDQKKERSKISLIKNVSGAKQRIKGKKRVLHLQQKGEQIQNQCHQQNFLSLKTFERRGDLIINPNQQNITQKSNQKKQKEYKLKTVVHLSQREQLNQKQQTKIQQKQKVQKVMPLTKKFSKRFNIPFETYYYRDLIWKVNYSNQRFVEAPLQYEHRLKIFVGKGNNSCMVSGLIARRPWFAFTDKVEQANFVWTQLKKLEYFRKQEEFKGQLNTNQREHSKYQSQSLLTDFDSHNFKSYFKTYFSSQEHCDQRFLPRSKNLKYTLKIKSDEIKDLKMQNHLINNYVLGNKKALFNTMTNYYKQMNIQVFDHLPLTFHIKDGMEDKKYFQFLRHYHKRAKEISKSNQEKGKVKQYNAWIVKPGQNSNRGNGIKMCLTLEDIKAILKKKQRYADGSYRTFIVQAYIQRPLLYFKRKFDLRHYIMMTSINGIIKGYWYKYGYVRTTSSQYSLNSNIGGIHLTNDAVQKNLADYGKYQKGNKISYEDLSAYIEKYHNKKGKGFYEYVYPKMKKIAADAMRACSGGIDPKKLQNNFQVFGMDFMIDANMQVWLIQINTNPCLQLSCPLLGCIIPKMIENALELTLDATFPPPIRYTPKGMHYFKQLQKQNKFELVYDERVEKLCTGSLQVLDNKLLEQQDDTFEDCGEDWQDS